MRKEAVYKDQLEKFEKQVQAKVSEQSNIVISPEVADSMSSSIFDSLVQDYIAVT